jgi:hypothetical protein
MWRLQGGSYIPGFTGTAYRAGLYGDVRETQEDQARKGSELNKYMSKREMIQKWGGRGLKALGVPSIVGDIGGYGLSKLFGGKAPEVGAGSDGTGLLGSGYEQLGEAAGGIEKSMLGRLGGSMLSSLSGEVGEKLLNKAGSAVAEYGADKPKLLGDWGARNIGLGGDKFAAETTAKALADNPWLSEASEGIQKFDEWSMLNPNQGYETYSDAITQGLVGPPSGWQMGGMMPGGVSNALPYQKGGLMSMMLSKLNDAGRRQGAYEENVPAADNVDMPLQALNWRLPFEDELSGSGEYGEPKMSEAQIASYFRGPEAQELMRRTGYADVDMRGYPEYLSSDYLRADTKGRPEVQDEEGYGWNPPQDVNIPQQGYQMGGSLYEQPMSYQLGGLLKYRRSPF